MESIDVFKSSIDPKRTRLLRLPKIILIFGGGPLGIEEEHRNSSFRNAFLNWTSEQGCPLNSQFKTPEHFPEWNRFEGYQNLLEFERDAGAFSTAILLFSEGPGSYAELGAFCMDEVLSSKLLVVISSVHYTQSSFISLGPLKKIGEDNSIESICVIESTTPLEFYEEAATVLNALQTKINGGFRRELIDGSKLRDQFLLIIDLVELFGAVTETELIGLLVFFDVKIERKILRRMIGQLSLFNLVAEAQQYTSRYIIAPYKDRDFYLDYEASVVDEKFDRSRFKILTFEELKKNSGRRKAYEQIHGRVPHESS